MYQRTRRLFYLLAAILVVGLVPLHTAALAAPADEKYVPGEVLVRLKPNVNAAAIAAEFGLDRRPRAIDTLQDTSIYRFKIVDGTPAPSKAARLRRESRGRIIYAEPNYVGQLPESVARSSWAKGDGEKEFHAQWAPGKLRLSEAHMHSRGAGVVVAVLDTGIDARHPLLSANLVSGFDFVSQDADPREEGVYGTDIAYGHGTHVAGLVLLAAPDARIMPIRVLRPDGTGSNWAVAQALLFAQTQGAAVINLSYTVPRRSKVIEDLLDQITCDVQSNSDCRSAELPGAVITAAAGNSSTPRQEYPAAARSAGIVSVAATTEADTVASFSTVGPWVRVAAPGEHIISSVPLDSGSEYGSWSGTSMAAPMTAGVAALIRATHPALSPAEVADRLVARAAPITGPVERRVDAAAPLDN